MPGNTTLNSLAIDQPTLHDLYTGLETSNVAPNQATPSNKNKAAHAALMSDDPEEVIETFSAVEAEMEEGTSTLADQIVATQDQRISEESKVVAIEEASNLEGSDVEQTDTLNRILREDTAPTNSRQVFKEKALIKDSGEESVSEEEVRLSMSEIVAQIDEEERIRQQMFLEAGRSMNPSMASAAVGFAELYLVPYIEVNLGRKISEAFLGKGNAGWLYGNNKAAIKQALADIPREERLAALENLSEIIASHQRIALIDDNDFAEYSMMRDLIATGEYSDTEKFIDNAFSIIEVAIPVVGGGLKAISRFIRSGSQLSTPAKSLRRTNPARSRNAHDAVLNDKTGEVAEALHGTNKTEAIADDLSPELLEDVVPQKTPRVGLINDLEENTQGLNPSPEVLEWIENRGNIIHTAEEKRVIRAAVANDFRNAHNMHLHQEMSMLGKDDAGKFSIRAVYGRKNGGWVLAKQAIERAKVSLKDYGIKDEHIVVLKNTAEGYVPLKPTDELTKKGDYLIQVDYKYEYNPTSVFDTAQNDVNYHIFSPVLSPLSRYVSPVIPRMVLDPGALFSKGFARSAIAAVEGGNALEKQLIHIGTEFSDEFHALSKEGRGVVWEYIKKANKEGLGDSYPELKAIGMDDAQVSVLNKWRKFWDTHWYLENRDLRKNIDAQGFKILEDKNGKHRLFARPMGSVTEGRVNIQGVDRYVYDPATDSVRTLNTDELTELYKRGGTVARLRHSLKVDDETVDAIMVTNKKGSYLRTLTDSDHILEYRPGYYHVQYTHPVFVVKKLPNGDERAVAVAGNIQDANRFLDDMAAEEGIDPSVWGRVRRDKFDRLENAGDYYDVAHSGGRSATRFRGQRLEDASAPINASLSENHIMNPVDSLLNSARSIARRVSMRDWLEASKKRWMDQYGHLSTAPRQIQDQPVYPRNFKEINDPGALGKEVAEAKQVWEYINSMENGYSAQTDTWVRSMLRYTADLMGTKGFRKTEEFLGAASQGKGIVGFSRNTAFQAYLATNPLRQFVVQSHQATQLLAIEPKYVTTKLANDTVGMIFASVFKKYDAAAKMMGISVEEAKRAVKAFDSSGIASGIDRQNLVDGGLTELLESSRLRGPVGRTAGALINAPRKMGFDFGEYLNLLTAYMTFRNRALRAGFDSDSAENALKIAADARMFTYQMNRAGEMPYNQNSAGMVLQFMQVPHKAATTILFNRSISAKERAQLLALNLVLYGVPTSLLINNMYDVLPDDPLERDLVTDGLESVLLNTAASIAFDEPSDIDFSNIAPLELHGWYEVARTLLGDGPIAALYASPSGKLLLDKAPKVVKTLGDVASSSVEDKDPKKVLSGIWVLGSLSSGYSNAFKATLALKYGKLYSMSGSTLDDEVSTPEKFGILLGFPTQDAVHNITTLQRQYHQSKEFEKDILNLYNEVKRYHFLALGEPIDKTQTYRDVMKAGNIILDELGPEARREFKRLLDRDLRKGDDTILRSAIRMSGIVSNNETKRSLIESGIDKEAIKITLENIEMLEKGLE